MVRSKQRTYKEGTDIFEDFEVVRVSNISHARTNSIGSVIEDNSKA